MSFIPPRAQVPSNSLVLKFWWKLMQAGLPTALPAFQYLLPTSQLGAASSASPIPAQCWARAFSMAGQPCSSPTHPSSKISIF